MASFSEFKLLPTIKETLDEKKIVRLTEIQERAVPLLLGRESVVGVSATGSDKTFSVIHQRVRYHRLLQSHGASRLIAPPAIPDVNNWRGGHTADAAAANCRSSSVQKGGIPKF
jgi:hypothetical protein